MLQVQIDEACRTATLAITNIDPHSGDDDGDEFVISAGIQWNRTTIKGSIWCRVDSAEHQNNRPSRQASMSRRAAAAWCSRVGGDQPGRWRRRRQHRDLPSQPAGCLRGRTTVLVSGATTTPSRTTSRVPGGVERRSSGGVRVARRRPRPQRRTERRRGCTWRTSTRTPSTGCRCSPLKPGRWLRRGAHPDLGGRPLSLA